MLRIVILAALLTCLSIGRLLAAEPDVASSAPVENTSDEPLAEAFSMASATAFLDSAALNWTKTRQCFTCHTNYAYLIARPRVGSDVPAHGEIRAALEKMVEERWPSDGPRWDAEVVMSAAVLAMNDAATTGRLHPTTRKALSRMWSVQREDGGFDWLKCGWPPMESDDDYGIAIAALALGAAPENYAESEEAQAGLKRLQAYLAQHPAPTLHHQAMLLWSERYGVKLLKPAEREACLAKLLELQRSDGGWSAASLGDWKRGDNTLQDIEHSDGYGTGFVVFVLRQAGIPSDDPRLERGRTWLMTHQRASGRWHTRSLNKDSKHYLSHAGTAFAVMALAD